MNKDNIAYCFLGGLILDDIKNEVDINSKSSPQYAVETFQRALIRGISETFGTLDIINLPFIGAFPLNYKKFYSPNGYSKQLISNNVEFNIHNIRFCDLIFLKLYFREYSARKALRGYLDKNIDKEKVYVFVYSVHLPFLRALRKLKNEYDNLRIITVVPDMPQYKNDILPWYKAVFLNYDTHVKPADYSVSDGYILLSAHMRDMVINCNQPYTVIEGIFNKTADKGVGRSSEQEVKTIFYSGTLARRYSIMNLVEAFCRIKRDDIRLVICGDGSCKEDIIQKSKVDSRVIYKGSLPHEKILCLQQESFLLVNPRTPEGDFTKYSFPSKTMEYLASGTPTLIYKLDGIPDEYYNYCFSLDDTSIDALSQKISEILELPSEKLRDIGSTAKKFIEEEKNPKSQCEKIKYLLAQIS